MFARCLPRAVLSGSLSAATSRFVSLRQVSAAKRIFPDDIYDVVVVGGGIAGLALVTALANSEVTKDLKIALIERNTLKPSVLTGVPANRCSSLTPGSVRFLQGLTTIELVLRLDIGAWNHIQQARIQPYYDMQVVSISSSILFRFGTVFHLLE